MRDQSTAGFRVTWAQTAQDRARAQALRHLAFRGTPGLDADSFDSAAHHLLIEGPGKGLAATCRVTLFEEADSLANSYSAQFYDLHDFAALTGRKAEIGRFCLHPEAQAPDLLRLCWAALAGFALDQGLVWLFGCSSFPGADAQRHAAALAWLFQNGLGPRGQRPKARPPGAVPLAGAEAEAAGVPDLLRFYTGLGAWVADSAILDRDLNTLHVFTALNIPALPPAKARLFHGLATSLAAPVDAAPKAV